MTDRSAIARLGAHSVHAKYDSRELTAKGRAKFLSRFEDEVDPDRTLSEADRMQRATAARRAYFSRLALLSARRRRERAS